MSYHQQDRRRKIFGQNNKLIHSIVKCDNINCKDINCTYAHNEFETLYHP